MSLYALQRCMFERTRSGDVTAGDTSGLDPAEQAALAAGDVLALYRFGVHSVLLNSYCRLIGMRRDDYRAVLSAAATDDHVEVPWRSS